ncbi:MAG: hypothetical protein EBS33_04225, partial [Alphaproteobacteria bacterium]|nr:hypothetical protein [Alphaproteobacteria bacterium]
FLSLPVIRREVSSGNDSDTIDPIDFDEKGIGIGSDIACSEIDGLSFVDSEVVTDTRDTEVVFFSAEPDSGAKGRKTSSDLNRSGAETSSSNGKLCKEDIDVKLLDTGEGDKL